MVSPPVGIDLFCGAGGLSCGMADAGFDFLLGIDSNRSAVDTFSANHDASALCCDIQRLALTDRGIETEADIDDPDGVLDSGLLEGRDVDLIVGGPPCPTFSRVGRSKIGSIDGESPETDDRHELYEDFIRFVDHYQPEAFVMENVEGIVSATNEEGESVADIIKGEMSNLGYTVNVQLVDAANFGVPQHRERVFFIGVLGDATPPDLEEWRTHRKPLHPSEKELRTLWGSKPSNHMTQTTLGDFRSTDDLEYGEIAQTAGNGGPWITVAEAILDLPPVSPEGTMPPTQATDYTLDPLTEYQDWARDVDENSDGQVLYNHNSRGHNLYDLSLYKLLGEGVGWDIGDVGAHLQPYREDIFHDKYKKQNPREPASTIVAHLSKDGHMFIHPREARSLTVREAARLQSFKDSFRFPEQRTNAFQLVGNAVPPRLAEAIGTALLTEVFDRSPSDSS